jgi:hypothetical protein
MNRPPISSSASGRPGGTDREIHQWAAPPVGGPRGAERVEVPLLELPGIAGPIADRQNAVLDADDDLPSKRVRVGSRIVLERQRRRGPLDALGLGALPRLRRFPE